MKSMILLTMTAALLSIVLGGCYTQLSTVRDDRYEPEAEQYTGGEDSSSFAEGEQEVTDEYGGGSSYEDDWQYRQKVGFTYYYPPSQVWPSTYFAAAYADPWFYDWNWSYDPFYYRHYYPHYYWWSGYYNPWYSHYWYYPPAYYYGGGHSWSSPKTKHRDFGTTRTSTASGRDGGGRGTTVGGASTPDVPRGAAISGGGRSGATKRTSKAVEPRRTPARERTYTPRGTYGGRSQSGSRTQDARQGGRENPPPSLAPGSQSGSSGRSGNSGGAERAPSGGSRDNGSRGRTPSYTPPPPPPQQSAPPPSSGGSSAPANSGSRGSGNRGGRP